MFRVFLWGGGGGSSNSTLWVEWNSEGQTLTAGDSWPYRRPSIVLTAPSVRLKHNAPSTRAGFTISLTSMFTLSVYDNKKVFDRNRNFGTRLRLDVLQTFCIQFQQELSFTYFKKTNYTPLDYHATYKTRFVSPGKSTAYRAMRRLWWIWTRPHRNPPSLCQPTCLWNPTSVMN